MCIRDRRPGAFAVRPGADDGRDGRAAAAPAPLPPAALGSPGGSADRRRGRGPLPPGARAAAGERGEVRAAQLGRLGRRLAPGRRDPRLHHRRRARRARGGLGIGLRGVRPGHRTSGPRFRDRALRRAPPDGGHGRQDLDRGERLRGKPVRGRASGRRAGLMGEGRMTLAQAAGLRILVVDDEPAMVGAITALVGTAGHQVITAYDGEAALRRFEEEGPDLVLLDLAMPGRDGVDVCREIRRTSQTPVIVLTGEADELAKVEALDAGADDYVTNPFGKQELLARTRAVMRRHEAGETPADVQPAGRLTLDTGRHEASVEGTVLALTRTEFALLAALASARGRVVPHDRLLAAGWPGDADPDPQWLKPHLARLRAKLEESAAHARGERRAG